MSDTPAQTHFSQPVRQITQMLIACGLVAAGTWVIFPSVQPVFYANLWLNGTIALVFVIGVLACFLQVAQLSSSVRWIETFARDHDSAANSPTPRLLAPLAALLRSRGVNRQISSTSASSILDSVATRIEEGRDITRYIVNLLIFLGLLGTFYGLATTVPAVVETIRSLAPKEGETGVQVFEKLMGGLEAQLGGMGTAFSSSLLGLAGSLVVGLLELFASRGQNRFYRELEEWLSSITRLGFAGGGETELSGETGALVGVLDHIAEQMENMRETHSVADASRSMVDDKLTEVAMAVTALTRTMQHGDRTTDVLERIAEGQERMLETQQQMLRRAGSAPSQEGDMVDSGGDAEARMRLRSIDVQLLRILEELAAGRQETVAELRGDIATMTREIRRARRQQGLAETGTVVGPDERPGS
ncbi:biopolymer transporter ExbB [Tropicimonas sp. TH_r6]|uniref:biopolymer transporter ExbB n=1 Tax=Tropicimonas sp. TH_r6 TaxID=3082085 RepID=UPI002953749C|nr:biopolymer transporter ExbB [Tropicimonas sp. TH_r6]MDV7143231.1 biopolymer transporter ExbB [Tropicimonas sp. TH_r6]